MKNKKMFRRIASLAMILCILVLSVPNPVKAEPVSGIYVNGITLPAEGATPDVYSLGIASGLPYQTMLLRIALDEVNNFRMMYTGEMAYDQSFVEAQDPAAFLLWYKSSDQTAWQVMAPDEQFEMGNYYKVRFFIQMDDCDNVASEKLPVYLNGESVEGDYRNRNELPYGGPVEIVFSNLATKTFSVFGVDEVVEPVVGEKPNFSSAYLYSSLCTIFKQKDFWSWYIPYGKTHAGTDYFNSFSDQFINAIPADAKIMWLESEDGEDWEYMINRKTGAISSFEYGKYYRVDIIIDIPEKGVTVSPWAWAYVNSKDNVAEFVPFTKSPENDYIITYVFDHLAADPEPSKNIDEPQEVEMDDLRFEAPSQWTLDDSQKKNGEIILYHGDNSKDADSILTIQRVEASQMEKNVDKKEAEDSSLSAMAYQYVKSQADRNHTHFKMIYAAPQYEINDLYVARITGIELNEYDNENLFSLADCSKERPLVQYVVVQMEDQYYVMNFTNRSGDFLDAMSFDQLLTTLQDMKNLSVHPEGQEFSNIMGYLQAARYSYGINEDGQKLYSNVLEIRNLNSHPINTSAVFNIYGTDAKGQEYLIKSGLKFYGLMGDQWWLDAGEEEITRVEFTQVDTTEASNALKFRKKTSGDGSVITLIPEGPFNSKDVQIMLGEDQIWMYPDSGSSPTIDLSQYKDQLKPWQDYHAFSINVVLYNK